MKKFDTALRVNAVDLGGNAIAGVSLTWKVKTGGKTLDLGPATTLGFLDKPVLVQFKQELDDPIVEVTASYGEVKKTELINIEKGELTMTLDVVPPEPDSHAIPRAKKSAKYFYAGFSLVCLVIGLGVGWYLTQSKLVVSSDQTAARGYYVLLAILALAAAGVLFGVLRSTASLKTNQFGAAIELGGPVVLAVLVVAGGFYATKQPDEFALVIRLRGTPAVTDAVDTYVTVDIGTRREHREFSRLGEANVPGIPVRFKNSVVPIEFQSAAYGLKAPMPSYKIPDDAVLYLDVVRLPNPQPTKAIAELCDGSPVVQLRTLGWDTFRDNNFDAAERAANSLEKCNKNDYMAYNIRGAVAFFLQKYDRAVTQFEKAVSLAPNMPDLTNNLADSLVELANQSAPERKADRLSKAVSLYESVRNPGDVSNYKIARAQFFAGEMGVALTGAKSVATSYEYEGGKGKARVLEGAIYLSMIKNEPGKKVEHLKMARAKFMEGIQVDREFWKGVFLENKLNRAEPFDVFRTAYGEYAGKWIAGNL